jgi:peptidoglycan hydrolase-like protein with peptidoglycan-binding domain
MMSDDDTVFIDNSNSGPDGSQCPRLLLVAAPQGFDLPAGTTVILPAADRVSIGRDPSCHLSFASTELSRKHIEIYFQNNRWIVGDCGSRNGTFLNGNLISSSPIETGDILQLGSIGFCFFMPGDAVVDTSPLAPPKKAQFSPPHQTNQIPQPSKSQRSGLLIGGILALFVVGGGIGYTFFQHSQPSLPISLVASYPAIAKLALEQAASEKQQALSDAYAASTKAEVEAANAKVEAANARADAEKVRADAAIAVAKAQAETELVKAHAEIAIQKVKAESIVNIATAQRPIEKSPVTVLSGVNVSLQTLEKQLSRIDRMNIQLGLSQRGHLKGAADGLFGSGTRKAIRAFKAENDGSVGEFLTQPEIDKLVMLAASKSLSPTVTKVVAKAPAAAKIIFPQPSAAAVAAPALKPAPTSSTIILANVSAFVRNPGKVVGAGACQKCHGQEHIVWEATKHSKSFATVHKTPEAKKFLASVGERRMRKSATCALCHYSVDASNKSKAISGPSCESCHGSAENWIKVHNDYGAAKIKANETNAQRQARFSKATAQGMIWPHQLFDVASNCNSCHGLTNPLLTSEQISAMLDHGHPLNPNFELVTYSQGSVRHRFYPPNVKENQSMSAAEKSIMYLVGQAATYVNASHALLKSKHAKYQVIQKTRISKARAILEAISGQVPEVSGLLSNPTTKAGHQFAEAIRGKDLTSSIKNMPSGSFK